MRKEYNLKLLLALIALLGALMFVLSGVAHLGSSLGIVHDTMGGIQFKNAGGFEPIRATYNVGGYVVTEADRVEQGIVGQPYKGIIAPTSIPVGTIMYLPYFKSNTCDGIFTVTESTTSSDPNQIWIYVNNMSEVKNLGNQTLKCYILGSPTAE